MDVRNSIILRFPNSFGFQTSVGSKWVSNPDTKVLGFQNVWNSDTFSPDFRHYELVVIQLGWVSQIKFNYRRVEVTEIALSKVGSVAIPCFAWKSCVKRRANSAICRPKIEKMSPELSFSIFDLSIGAVCPPYFTAFSCKIFVQMVTAPSLGKTIFSKEQS